MSSFFKTVFMYRRLNFSAFLKRVHKTYSLRGAHSSAVSIDMDEMKVKILPVLSDNYMYLVIDKQTKDAVAIDPVNPETILTEVEKENAQLKSVLVTHHHGDHQSGNDKLLQKASGLKVYGSDERVEHLTNEVRNGDKIEVGNLTINCLYTPCHTSGHFCYYVNGQAVFTGDTMFVSGCGRFLEGTAIEMYRSLIKVLGALPNHVKVFCGHEYTVANLKFANQIEPDNDVVKDKLQWALLMRAKGQPTIPSTIGEEKKTNPFMRVCEKQLQSLANASDPICTLAFIRKEKDKFKIL